MKIIDGKKIADKIKDEIVADIITLNNGDISSSIRPSLAIVLVGDRKDSEIYVGLKEKAAKTVGIDTHLYKIPNDSEQKEIEDTILFLNNDKNINAILLQLPLPKKFDTDKLIKMINPEKDVDRFHPDNLKKMDLSCNFRDDIIPPLLQTILEILADVKIDLQEKNICALVNSDILGRSIKRVFECRGAKVNICKSDNPQFSEETNQADILISAVGEPGIITKNCVKKGACVIDIGISKKNNKILGDVDFENVIDKVEYITPVPGGVGPITIATALKNTLNLYKRNID